MIRTRSALHVTTTATIALVLSLTACTPAAPTNPASQDAATPTSVATGEAAARTPTLAAAAVVTATAAVTGTAPAELPAGASPPTLADLGVADPAAGAFEAVAVHPVAGPAGRPLWVAHTTGARGYDPGGPHVVAVLDRASDTWRLVDRMELGADVKAASATPDPDAYFGPDYLAPDGVAAAAVEPTHLWLTVDGGVGAHGGSFALLSFDGAKLTLEAHASNGFPGVGRVEDLNGDGVGEVILDRTDAYVFCYACGVRAASVDVLKWRDGHLTSVTLRPLADGANATDVRLALDAVSGGFWDAAYGLLHGAIQSDPFRQQFFGPRTPTNATVVPSAGWDILMDDLLVIEANWKARTVLNRDDAPYPLLQHVFVGDWSGAVEPLRSIAPDRLFAPDSPLVAGTPAEGNVAALAERIADAAGAALQYGPKLANAPYPLHWRAADSTFLRGWSAWLAAPGDAAARADIAEAAALAPDDPLYTASAAWIAQQP